MRNAGRGGRLGFETRLFYFLAADFALSVRFLLDSRKRGEDGVVARLEIRENGRIALAARDDIGLIDGIRFGSRFRRHRLPVVRDARIPTTDVSHFRFEPGLLRFKFFPKVFGLHAGMIADCW